MHAHLYMGVHMFMYTWCLLPIALCGPSAECKDAQVKTEVQDEIGDGAEETTQGQVLIKDEEIKDMKCV